VAWFLGTVVVRFARVDGRGPLTDAELDRLADVLIRSDGVATVRVEPHGRATVVRIDVRAAARDEVAALAVRPLEEAARELALEARVESVAVH
jgi:carbon monoxide dehydrogenase subunit G